MQTCARCGQENPDVAHFCLACGAELGRVAETRHERKVVTVLFADLVGFTSRSETLDPDDVGALLAAYHARVKYELERHGATVDAAAARETAAVAAFFRAAGAEPRAAEAEVALRASA